MGKRLAYVDGLRAIAVLAVALFHSRVHVLGINLELWAKECAHGVDLFFVVSGFCLAFPTFERLRTAGHARFDAVSYALKRFLRIFPPFAVAAALIALIGSAAATFGLPLPEGMKALGPVEVLQNLLFLDKSQEYVNKSFWSLGIEFRWYFVFPFALWLAVRNMRAFVTVIVLAAIAGEFTRAGSVDVGVLPAFLLGVAAAYIRTNGHPIVRYALPCAFGAFVFGMLDEQRPHFPIQTNVGWHAVAFFFVIAAGATPWLQRVLAQPWLTRIGSASYSIYLLHEPIVSKLSVALRPALGDVGATLAAISAGVAAGFVFWAVVERPLTDPAFVARFVERGRARTAELFDAFGAARSFDLRFHPTPLQQEAI
jgi:peptidoglycan/LPS O-acetylase OafA/YrhL